MARPIWKGNITFGLVNVPVTLFGAESHDSLDFDQLDRRDYARIRYRKVNEKTGHEVASEDIVKGYAFEEGRYVIMHDEDFRRAAPELTRTIEIDGFVDAAEINPVYFDRPYFLVPGKAGEKGYALLRETLLRSGRAGVTQVVIHSRQYLAVLRATERMLVLNLLRYAHELRAETEFETPSRGLRALKISERELELADKLVDAMEMKWEPENYEDEYRKALLGYINRRVKEGRLEDAGEPEEPEPDDEEPTSVIDIMELLKQSVEESGSGSRRRSAPARKAPAAKAPARKAAAAPKATDKRKAPAAKSPARKAAAKKTVPAKRKSSRGA